MSRRNALVVAVVAAVVLAAIFLWPERARADIGFSARIGGHHGGHHGGFHGSHAGLYGGIAGGFRGGLRGGKHFGGHIGRYESYGHGRGVRKHGVLIGDRFRSRTLRHIDRKHGHRSGHHGVHGGRHFRGRDFGHHGSFRHDRRTWQHGLLIGDRFRSHTLRDLHERHRNRDHDFREHQFRGVGFHRRDWHGHLGPHLGPNRGKWLGSASAVLSYDDPDAFVREIIVPVPVASARQAERAPPASAPPPLDPRGRVVLVGAEAGVVGDWAPGDVLPDGFPHVALDPVAYGLDQPPAGEKYARVGNDVLRIDIGSRRITEVVAR